MSQDITPNESNKETSIFNNGNDDTSKYITSSYENIKTDLITITRDKLEIILLKHLNNSVKKSSWITPFSLFSTFLITLITTDFKNNLPISADTMTAIFIILCCACFIWLIIEIVNAIKRGKKQTIDNLIEKIAKNDG